MALVSDAQVLTYLSITTPANVAKYSPLVALLRPVAERLIRKYVGYAIELATFTEYWPLLSNRPAMSQGYTEDEEILAYEGSPQGARPIRQGRGNSRDTLWVRHKPLRQVTSIYEDLGAWLDVDESQRWPANSLLIEGRDFQVDWERDFAATDQANGLRISNSGFIYRNGAIWSLMARTVKITYQAGYTPAELAATGMDVAADDAQDFTAATLITAAKLVKEAIANGIETPGTTGVIVAEAIDGYNVTYAQPLQGVDVSLCNDIPLGAKKLLEERVHMGKFF